MAGREHRAVVRPDRAVLQSASARSARHRRRRRRAGHQGHRPGADGPAHPRADRRRRGRSEHQPEAQGADGAADQRRQDRSRPQGSALYAGVAPPGPSERDPLAGAQPPRTQGRGDHASGRHHQVDHHRDPQSHPLERRDPRADGPGDARSHHPDRTGHGSEPRQQGKAADRRCRRNAAVRRRDHRTQGSRSRGSQERKRRQAGRRHRRQRRVRQAQAARRRQEARRRIRRLLRPIQMPRSRGAFCFWEGCGSETAAVDLFRRERAEIEIVEATGVHRDHLLAVRRLAFGERQNPARLAEQMRDGVLVEAVFGLRVLALELLEFVRRGEGEDRTALLADRAVAGHGVAEVDLGLEADRTAMASAAVFLETRHPVLHTFIRATTHAPAIRFTRIGLANTITRIKMPLNRGGSSC